MLRPTAGRTRIASLRHAWKYGRAWTSFHDGNWLRLPFAVAPSISSFRRAWIAGSRKTWWQKDCIVEAVESDPAKLELLLVFEGKGYVNL